MRGSHKYVERSSMAERQIVVLNMRVQFPSLTPCPGVGKQQSASFGN